MAQDDSDDATPTAAPAKKGGGLLVIVLAVILSAGAAGGVSWFVAQHFMNELKPAVEGEDGEAAEEEAAPKDPAHYFALEPAFVVNLDDEHAQRFLQVQVQVMTRNEALLEEIERHAPRIRSALLLLFGQQKAENLVSRAGKEQLQADVLAEVQRIIKEETGEDGIEAVYFTSFVMQ